MVCTKSRAGDNLKQKDWASLQDWPNLVCIYGRGTVGNPTRVGVAVAVGGGRVGDAVGVGVKVSVGVAVTVGDGV